MKFNIQHIFKEYKSTNVDAVAGFTKECLPSTPQQSKLILGVFMVGKGKGANTLDQRRNIDFIHGGTYTALQLQYYKPNTRRHYVHTVIRINLEIKLHEMVISCR